MSTRFEKYTCKYMDWTLEQIYFRAMITSIQRKHNAHHRKSYVQAETVCLDCSSVSTFGFRIPLLLVSIAFVLSITVLALNLKIQISQNTVIKVSKHDVECNKLYICPTTTFNSSRFRCLHCALCTMYIEKCILQRLCHLIANVNLKWMKLLLYYCKIFIPVEYNYKS